MDNMQLRYLMIVGAGLSLVGMCISGLMLTKAQGDAEKRAKRLESVVSPHLRPAFVETSAYSDAKTSSNRSVLGAVGWVFGFNPDKASLYPTKWWVAVAGSLLVAKVLESVVADFLGSFALPTIPVLWIVLSRYFFRYFEQRRQLQLLSEFADALAMMVRAIRVGIPVMEALRNVSRASPPATAREFAILIEQVTIGVPLDEALLNLANRTGLPEYRFFVTTLVLQNQTGGTLSDTLDSLADVIRKRTALKAKGRAMTSEARSSSMVLAVLPILTGAMLWVINPKYIGVLFTDPTGKSMLGLAIILLLSGVVSIHAIIKSTLS